MGTFVQPLVRPVDKKYKITSVFGAVNPALRDGLPHKGVDFGCPTGTHVYACFDGVVELIKDETEGTEKQRRAGRRLIIYSRTHKALYFHLLSPLCELGQKVKRGDVIALSGATGVVTGPHLHFEIRTLNDDEPIEPEFA